MEDLRITEVIALIADVRLVFRVDESIETIEERTQGNNKIILVNYKNGSYAWLNADKVEFIRWEKFAPEFEPSEDEQFEVHKK